MKLKFYSALSILGLFSSVLAKRSSICGSNTLDDGCSISDDCDTVNCKMKFVDKPITIKLKVDCDGSVTASIDVPDLHISWSHIYTSDDTVEVPRFTALAPGFQTSVGVYLQVSLTPQVDRLRLTVNLLTGGKIFGKGSYPIKVTVFEGSLPIKIKECATGSWTFPSVILNTDKSGTSEQDGLIKASLPMVITSGVILLLAACFIFNKICRNRG